MIKLSRVNHKYINKDISFTAITDISLTIPNNKFVVILGDSGAGKTTLLNIIAGLLKPTKGNVLFENKDIYSLSNKEMAIFRKDNIGFVFQNYFLEPNFTVLENVLVPLFLNNKLTNEMRIKIAKSKLKIVGLEDKINNKPYQLSGGESQRVAIARALVNNPKILIADEPTGNLDSKNGDNIIRILREFVSEEKSVIMVTHNSKYVCETDLVFTIKDGQVL